MSTIGTGYTTAQLADLVRTAMLEGVAVPIDAYADEVRVRHMTGDCTPHVTPGASIAAALAAERSTFRTAMPDFAYAGLRFVVGDDAFTLTTALNGTTTSGRTIDVPMCVVFSIEDGRIAAMDAYMDSVLEAEYIAVLRDHGFGTGT